MPKISNRAKIENFLALLKHYGHVPYDVHYGDGYFIFEHGKDTVCHFRIKGCRGWLFGVWLNTATKEKRAKDPDSDYELDFFFQYEKDIDKFKPSASNYAYKIDKSDYNVDGACKSYRPDWSRGITLIKRHRQVARYYWNDDWVPSWYCFYRNMSNDLYEIKGKIKKWFYRLTLFVYCKMKFRGCKLINNNYKNCEWHVSPEWNIKIKNSKKISDRLWTWSNKADVYIGVE